MFCGHMLKMDLSAVGAGAEHRGVVFGKTHVPHAYASGVRGRGRVGAAVLPSSWWGQGDDVDGLPGLRSPGLLPLLVASDRQEVGPA